MKKGYGRSYSLPKSITKKMEKEFNLREERRKLFKKYRLLEGFKKLIMLQDKEFIKRLKKEIGRRLPLRKEEIDKIFNKLAGKDLI